MMDVALRLALFLLAGSALLTYLGYAPARLLVPAAAQSARLLLAPVLGVCVLAIGASFLTYLLPMPGVLAVLATTATLANLVLLRHDRWRPFPRPTRAETATLAIAFAAYAIGSLPQLHAGTLAFLGVQWDLEIYLPLSDYLKRYAMGGHLTAYPNPLLDMMNDTAVRGGSGWGFMYFDAALGTLTGWPAFETFRPSLLLAFAISVPAVYSLCRWGFRMGAGASLMAAALAGCNGLNLWIAMIGLGGHALTFALLPASVLAVLWVVREPSWRAAALCGMTAAGLLLSFYTGAAAVFAAIAAPIGAYALVRGPRRAAVLAAAAGAVGALAAFGLVAHVRFVTLLPQYFRDGFSEGWKVTDFVSLSQALGLAPFALVQQHLGNQPYVPGIPLEVIAPVTTAISLVVVALLVVAALRPGWERWPWLAGLAGLALFAIVLRWAAPYPYGYFKVFSLGGFLVCAGIGQGAAVLAGLRWRPAGWPASLPAPRRLALGGLALTALVAAPLAAANTTQSLRYYWDTDPDELPRTVWELQTLRSVLPAGAPVYVTGRSGFDPRLGAMVGYFLLDNPVVGSLKSAYGKVQSARPDEPYQYLLFQNGERPEESGLGPQDVVWRNDLVTLYRRPSAWVTAVDLESVGRPVSLGDTPVRIALQQDTWSLDNGTPLYNGALARHAGAQQVEMTLLAMDSATAIIDTGAAPQQVTLPAGVISYRSAAIPTPTTVTLALPKGSPDVRLLGLRVLDGAPLPPGTLASKDLLVLQLKPSVDGNRGRIDGGYLVNDSRGAHLSLAVEFYRRAGGGLSPAGFVQLTSAKQAQSDRVAWEGDLSTEACDGGGSGPPRSDGEYEAHIAAYHVNNEVYRQRWLRFSVAGGRVTRTTFDPLPAYTVQYLSTPRELQALAKVLPEGATVYTPITNAPDDSFAAAAAASLPGRTFAGDLRGKARPGYVLLPKALDPESLGLPVDGPRWLGETNTLYPLERGVTGYLAFPQPIALNAAAPLTVSLAAGRLSAAGGGQTAEQAMAGGGEQATVLVRGVAATEGELTLTGGGAQDSVRLKPGAFTYRTPVVRAGPTALAFAATPAQASLRVLSITVLSGEVRGMRLVETLAAEVSATVTDAGGNPRLLVDYFGPARPDTVVGIDIYAVAACNAAHFGWWAGPLSTLGLPGAFDMDLKAKQVSLMGQRGRVALDSQTFATGDGTYRGFVMVKQGEQFATLPAFEFTLRNGAVTRLLPFSSRRLVEVGP